MSVTLDYIQNLNRDVLDGSNPSSYTSFLKTGLSETLVRHISKDKEEPAWMLEHRLKSLEEFYKRVQVS